MGLVVTSRHPACLSEIDLKRECTFQATRGSGPGGQHRNKVETAAVWTHEPTKVRGQASERRSQGENKSVAWQRLRLELAIHIRSQHDSESKWMSPLWAERVHGGKLSVSAEHVDFPELLANSLDLLEAYSGDVKSLAEELAVTTSQLVKFWKLAPLAFQAINAKRREKGEHQLL